MIVDRDTFITDLRQALTKEMARLHFCIYLLKPDELLVQTAFLGQDIHTRVDFNLPGISDVTADEIASQARVYFLAQIEYFAERWDLGTHEWPPLTFGDALTAMAFGVEMCRKDWRRRGKRLRLIRDSHIEMDDPLLNHTESFIPTHEDLMATDWMRA